MKAARRRAGRLPRHVRSPAISYKNRVIKLDFTEELSDDPADPIFVVIRNPRLLPPAELQSFSSGDGTGTEPVLDGQGEPVLDEEGKPKVKVTDAKASTATLHKMVARLVVAARVPDATAIGDIDPETGDPVGGQPRMPPPPWDEHQAAKLPLTILERVSKTFGDAVNPQTPLSGSTPTMSSSLPSPSTTEPGAGGQSPPS